MGTADQIWQGHATLKKAQLLSARDDAAKKAGQPTIKDAELTLAMFTPAFEALRSAFVAAEKRYGEWLPKQEDGTEITA
ncbi:MAG: hypothetical protein ABIP94_24565 [Planctomycetota bacterium]